MKIVLLLALTLSSINAFAEKSDVYCQNESKKVYYINRENTSGSIRRSDILKGELVASLGDGTAVIVPCFREYAVSKDQGPVSSLIIKQKNVFSQLHGRLDNRIIIGANYKNATVIAVETHLMVLDSYSVQDSPELLRLNNERAARSIHRK